MDLLEKAIIQFVESISDSELTWDEVKKNGEPAEVVLRNTYRGYVYRKMFHYLDKNGKHCSSPLDSLVIRSNLTLLKDLR